MATWSSNNFRALISVAIAYDDNDAITSEGWWKVQPGVCSDIEFSGLDFYYTAESDSYRQGSATSRDNWGKGQQFYVAVANSSSITRCARAGAHVQCRSGRSSFRTATAGGISRLRCASAAGPPRWKRPQNEGGEQRLRNRVGSVCPPKAFCWLAD